MSFKTTLTAFSTFSSTLSARGPESPLYHTAIGFITSFIKNPQGSNITNYFIAVSCYKKVFFRIFLFYYKRIINNNFTTHSDEGKIIIKTYSQPDIGSYLDPNSFYMPRSLTWLSFVYIDPGLAVLSYNIQDHACSFQSKLFHVPMIFSLA